MPIGTFVILLNRRIAAIIGDVVMVRREYFLEAMVTFRLQVLNRQFRNH